MALLLAPPPWVDDAAVGPVRLDAEDFVGDLSWVAQDDAASGGSVVQHRNALELSGMPFPRSSRPVTVYVRIRPGCARAECLLYTAQGGNRQALSTIETTTRGEWQWLRFPPAFAGETGDQFSIGFKAHEAAQQPTLLDAVVIATDETLKPHTLDAAPALFSHDPLALVARCAAAPEIDGRGDDACWENTVACTNFQVVRSQAPAKADTAARACYDENNLYFLFTCEEPLLDVRMQRRHEFCANATERDGKVSVDDACVILLDPGCCGAGIYDFFVNALGTIEDAGCTPPDLWSSRDKAWNANAMAAGETGDGTWTVEVAIPFFDLTGRAPQPGEVWQACLGRIAKARSESSSWNLSDRGFHEPVRWGGLMFAGPTPGLALDVPRTLELGKNTCTVRLTPLPEDLGGVYVATRIASQSAVRHMVEFVPLDREPVGVNHEFRIEEEGALAIDHAVLDAATLRPLYRTPKSRRGVKSSLATVHLACDGPYTLFLNDEVIATGPQAEPAEIAAPLQQGANVFALKLDKGTAAVRIETPDWTPDHARWKMASPDVADAALAQTDDASWQTAPTAGQHEGLGPRIGQPGQPVVLRHTLLWQKTRLWPTPKPALYLARNSNQHVTFIADGLPGKKLLDWTAHLAVPPAFDILGATGYYGEGRDYQPEFVCEVLGEREVAGRTMRLATISATKPIAANRHYIMSLFNAFVRYPVEAGEPMDEETGFLYWTEANDSTMIEPVQSIPVRLLPPLDGRQPKRLVCQLWGSFFSAMDNRPMREAALETARAAGINDLVGGDRWTGDHAHECNMRHTICINFQAWSLGMADYLEQHPDQRLIGQDGKPNDEHVCMTHLLDDAWPAVAEKLKAKIEAVQPDTLDYDYEYPPYDAPHACYCPRCLAAFRAFEGLPDDVDLSPEIIKDKHNEEWVDFMARRVARMFRKFKDEIHRIAPGTEFSVYSGYQGADNPQRYGVNWQYVGELQAVDQIGCGYGRPAERVAATVEAASGIATVFGALHHPHNPEDLTPPTPFTKARLLRRALDATGGILVYDRQPLDGRSWSAIAETTRLIAAYEDLFLDGTLSALAGLDESQVQRVDHGSVNLVCVMNGTRNEATYVISIPPSLGQGREFYGGAIAAGGETIDCVIPAGDTAVYVFGK